MLKLPHLPAHTMSNAHTRHHRREHRHPSVYKSCCPLHSTVLMVQHSTRNVMTRTKSRACRSRSFSAVLLRSSWHAVKIVLRSLLISWTLSLNSSIKIKLRHTRDASALASRASTKKKRSALLRSFSSPRNNRACCNSSDVGRSRCIMYKSSSSNTEVFVPTRGVHATQESLV